MRLWNARLVQLRRQSQLHRSFLPIALLGMVCFYASVSVAQVCLYPKGNAQSQSPGTYCGGDAQLDVPDTPNHSVDVNRACKATHGNNATAVPRDNRSDAYAWVCRVAGQPDVNLDMQAACRLEYGGEAIATLVGLSLYDWRCLTPADVRGHVVPVLIFPQDKMFDSNQPAFVTVALQRLGVLMGGVRRFYRERSSYRTPGTNAFLLLSKTSSQDWQNIALCTDQASCNAVHNPFPFARDGYANRITQELTQNRWNVLVDHSSVIVGAFVTLGASPPQPATWCGAYDLNGHVFVGAPSNSYAACTSSTNNPPEYEDAFYGAAHEFGHAVGLRHSNDPHNCPDAHSYVFHDTDLHSNLLRPPNLTESIMCTGKGTSSPLFPFEACATVPFLRSWH